MLFMQNLGHGVVSFKQISSRLLQKLDKIGHEKKKVTALLSIERRPFVLKFLHLLE